MARLTPLEVETSGRRIPGGSVLRNFKEGREADDWSDLGSHAEQFLKELHLANHLLLGPPPDSSLFDPGPRFDSWLRFPGSPAAALPPRQSSSSFHEAVVLLHPLI